MAGKGKVAYKNGVARHGKSARWEECLPNGTKLLYSYSTVVGVYSLLQDTLLLTTKRYSITTSKHLAQFAAEYAFAETTTRVDEALLRDFVQTVRRLQREEWNRDA